MSENHDHLDLPSVSDTYQRKTRQGGPSQKIKRDHSAFSETQIEKLDSKSKLLILIGFYLCIIQL